MLVRFRKQIPNASEMKRATASEANCSRAHHFDNTVKHDNTQQCGHFEVMACRAMTHAEHFSLVTPHDFAPSLMVYRTEACFYCLSMSIFGFLVPGGKHGDCQEPSNVAE